MASVHSLLSPEPPIAVLGAVAGCPRPLTSFIGRERELAAVWDLLASDHVRLVTLTGPGGVGKTRLALRAVEAMAGYPDGVAFVALAAVRDPALVGPTIAAALGMGSSTGSSVTSLTSHLRHDRELVVLDNFEQVIEAATLVAALLAGCPDLRILITSRVDLHISGEHVFPVSPLPLPLDADHAGNDITSLSGNASVRLFAERASARSATFNLTPDNVAAVANVCRMVDGLPLAIELAAARITVLDPAALATRLNRRMALLTGGPRDLTERQRSIRATVAWSHDLLAPATQRFFRRMSVFVGGFTIAAAEHAGGLEGDADPDALSAITMLVDSSLLQTVPGSEGEPRYVMLETIREFGLEQLVASGEETDARQAHAEWCLELVRGAKPDRVPYTHLDTMRWADALGTELGNLRAALSWLHDSGRTDALAELVTGLRIVWFLGAHEPEGLEWHRRILALPLDPTSPLRAEALAFAGQLTVSQDNSGAERLLTEALDLARERDDLGLEARTLRCLGNAAEDRGDWDEAESRYLRARERYERLHDTESILMIEFHLGVIAWARGEAEQAEDRLERCSAAAEAIGDPLVSAWCATDLALIACERGHPARAAELLAQVFSHHHASMRHLDSMRLAIVAVVAAATGEDTSAARLFGASETAERGVKLPLPERIACGRVAAAVRDQLGAEAYDQAGEAGRRLGDAAVLAEVHEVLDRASRSSEPPESAPPALPISERELEVLRLLTEGRSDAEIAAALFISRRTVATHVAHIYQKLGVTGRAAAAAWAVRRGLC